MTDEARAIRAQLVAALKALHDLDKLAPVEAEQIWTALGAHLRSARPMVLGTMEGK